MVCICSAKKQRLSKDGPSGNKSLIIIGRVSFLYNKLEELCSYTAWAIHDKRNSSTFGYLYCENHRLFSPLTLCLHHSRLTKSTCRPLVRKYLSIYSSEKQWVTILSLRQNMPFSALQWSSKHEPWGENDWRKARNTDGKVVDWSASYLSVATSKRGISAIQYFTEYAKSFEA